jgi:PAS domain S-box-containing protein
MRQALVVLTLVILLPILLVQAVLYHRQFQYNLDEEYKLNLEIARIMALGFDQFVHDIQEQELAMGRGILLLNHLDTAAKTRYLVENDLAYPSVLLFGWTEPDGTITLSSMKEAVGVSIRHRAYFQKIVAGSDSEISDLMQPLIGKDWTIAIARGIRDESHRLQGIILAIVDPDLVGKRAFTVRQFEGGSATIFDSQGVAVFRVPNVPLTHALRVELGRRQPALKLALAGQEARGTVISAVTGVKNISAVVPIHDIGWAVSASRPEEIAFSNIRRNILYNLILVISVGVLSLTVGFFIARRIEFQTRQLKDYAMAIGKDKTPRVMGGKMIAELDEVAVALTKMADRLEERELAVRQSAELAERRAEELDAIFDAMGQGVMIYNDDGKFTRVNPLVRRMFGFDPMPMEPGVAYERINLRLPEKQGVEVEMLPFKRALHGESVMGERYVFTNVNGEDVIVVATSTPLYMGDKIIGAVTVWQDVTERERLLHDLRISEEKYRELVQSANSIILRLDAEGRITFFNEYAQKFFGYTEEEILGRPSIETIVPPIDSNGRNMEEMVEDIVHHPEMFASNENENICRDGRRVWIAWNNRPIYDEQGRFKEIMAIGNDVTGRKKAENALKESEKRFRRLAEASTYGLIIGGKTGEVMYTNPAATRMLGYSLDEFEKAKINWLDLTPEEYKGLDQKAITELEAKGFFTPFERVVIVKSGRQIPILMGGAELEKKVDGTVIVALFLTDLTQLKEAQKALRSAYDELEVRVQERTAELQRSNEELARFTYVASHDLQEPLRMVTSYTQLLEMRYKDKLGAEANQFIEYATEGACRMRDLIKAILEYSQITTQAKPFRPVPCERVLEKAVQNLKVMIDESGAKITHEPLPMVQGDEAQLVQVFQHLIENAIKFRKEGIAPEIHIGATWRDPEWLFSVKDNGIGIERIYYDQIFTIFKRLHGHQKYQGVGVGLAVVKRIIERHKGIIYLESQPGVGTTFYFTLPGEAEKR